MTELPRVSVLFITCNRAHTLVATYESFVRRVEYPRERLELILCDDASEDWHRAIIDQLAFGKVVRADRNRGLGANQNAGVRAAAGDFILTLQDDCMLTGDGDFLRRTVAAMVDDPSISMVAYRERPELPVLERRATQGAKLLIYGTASGASGCGDYPYSDQPNVKRADFHDAVGWFREGVAMTVMELDFQRRVSAEPSLVVAALVGPDPFAHIGAPFSLNPAHAGAGRRERLYRMPLIGLAYRIVRRSAGRLSQIVKRRNRPPLQH